MQKRHKPAKSEDKGEKTAKKATGGATRDADRPTRRDGPRGRSAEMARRPGTHVSQSHDISLAAGPASAHSDFAAQKPNGAEKAAAGFRATTRGSKAENAAAGSRA